MMQHPVQPYKGLSPCKAVAKTGVHSGETTAEKPPENYLNAPQRVFHNKVTVCLFLHSDSVTRFGDLMDFGQLFKAFGNN